MAIVYTQHDIPFEANGQRVYWLYNGLDCCVTRDVYDVLADRLALDPEATQTYAFERAIQSPAMAMMLRGVRIDERLAAETIEGYEQDQTEKEHELAELAKPYWDRLVKRTGKCTDGGNHKWPRNVEDSVATCEKCSVSRLTPDGPNPRSPAQIMDLLYKRLALPEQKDHKTHKASVNDECVQKLKHKFPQHNAIFDAILDTRKIRKQISLLKSKVSADGRWHSSFNVGATEVDRWSSSKSALGEGTNLQNIADRSRGIIVPDPGMWLVYADLKSAESRIVAYDAQDAAYIAAHERPGADVHTEVVKMMYPELPWPELENCHAEKHDPEGRCCQRGFAETSPPFDPHHDYRTCVGKRIQHGSNIGMTPVGVAREAHIPQALAKEMQKRYFDAFHGVSRRQREIIHEVRTTGALRTFLGRRRQFFGRLWDDSTWREALAQTQQSTIGWLINMALWRVWSELDTCITPGQSPCITDPNKVWLLAQVHDALLFEVRAGDFETLKRVKELMTIPIPIKGRTLTIPVEIAYSAKSWKHSDLVEWKE